MSSGALLKREKTLLDEKAELWKNELYLVLQLYYMQLYCIRTKTLFLLIYA